KKSFYQHNVIKFRQRATIWIVVATTIFVIINTGIATWRYLGSRADSAPAAVPTTADPTSSTLEVFSTEIQALRSAWLGQMFSSGLIESVALNVQANDNRIKFSGTAVLNVEQLPTGMADQQLLSLTPASATFLRLGGNFAEELSTWLVTATAADSTIPIITLSDSLRQTLRGPYALYATQVDPAPAAPRLSLVIALQADHNMALGNKELEALLLEAAPLLLGQTLAPDQSFKDSSYKGTALRFTNNPNETGAIDYTILPGYLLISTAKDNMFELMDVYSGAGPSLANDSAAGKLLEQWGALPAGTNLMIGYVAPLLDPDAVGADQIATSYLAGLAISPSELPGQAIIEGLLVPQEDAVAEPQRNPAVRAEPQ
ncbi:hypothetical protein IH781_01495, partial [Patescibacteria group bacterium]|nr:hypothetical protein [Patescibacteria group bacterium]